MFPDSLQARVSSVSEDLPLKSPPPAWARWLAWILGNSWRMALTLCILDVLAASLGVVLSGVVRHKTLGFRDHLTNYYISLLICYNIYLVVICYLNEGYGQIKETRPEDELRIIVISNLSAFFFVLATDHFFDKNVMIPHSIFILGFIFTTFLLMFFRFTIRNLLSKIWGYGLSRQNVIIVGDFLKNIKWLWEQLHIQQYNGFNLLGYVAEKPSETIKNSLPYLGKFSDIANIAKTIRVDKAFFAMSGYGPQRHQTLVSRLEECARLKIPFMMISPIINNFRFSLTLDGYTGIFVVNSRKPAYARPLYRLVKRTMDIFASLLLLVLSWPIWLMVMVAIKLQDGGPIFYRHRRVGKDRKIFYALKFRTMVTNAREILLNNPQLFEEFQGNYKLEGDPRVTSIGKLLRKTSLDELPQLINILKGEMSLVGPRPIIEEEEERFGDFKDERVKIRPGLTGFWQVSGRINTSYEERIQMDKFYMNKCNIWMDLVILLKTPIIVIFGRGAV